MYNCNTIMTVPLLPILLLILCVSKGTAKVSETSLFGVEEKIDAVIDAIKAAQRNHEEIVSSLNEVRNAVTESKVALVQKTELQEKTMRDLFQTVENVWNEYKTFVSNLLQSGTIPSKVNPYGDTERKLQDDFWQSPKLLNRVLG